MIELTKTDKKKLQSYFKNNLLPETISIGTNYNEFGHPMMVMDFHIIQDDKLQQKLYDYYGLNVDENWHKTPAFTFWYDWKIQMWRVGA